MVYKPGDYFVGVVDFFAILMPGALFSFLLLRLASKYHFGPILPKAWGAAEHWVTFIFASYLLGHFISLLGANLDGIYDRTYRKYAHHGEAEGGCGVVRGFR